jgi:hypothetical protein
MYAINEYENQREIQFAKNEFGTYMDSTGAHLHALFLHLSSS